MKSITIGNAGERPLMARVEFVLEPYDASNDIDAHDKANSLGESIQSLIGDTSMFDVELGKEMKDEIFIAGRYEVIYDFGKVIIARDGLQARKKIVNMLKMIHENVHPISQVVMIVISGIKYDGNQQFDDLVGDFDGIMS
jgi:hypothetical protein